MPFVFFIKKSKKNKKISKKYLTNSKKYGIIIIEKEIQSTFQTK